LFDVSLAGLVGLQILATRK